jgi:phage baseplate assembly protein W
MHDKLKIGYCDCIKIAVKMATEKAKRENREEIASVHQIGEYLESIIVTPSGKAYVKREYLHKIMI